MHRIVKDRVKLAKMAQKKRKGDNRLDYDDRPSVTSVTSMPKVSEDLLNRDRMRALEKDLKARMDRGQSLEGHATFNAIYKGNKLRVSIESDSESEVSIDSFEGN